MLLTCCLCALLLADVAAEPTPHPLSELVPESAVQGWGMLTVDRAVGGQPLSIAGRAFAQGLGTHATSRVTYDLDGAWSRFTAWVGIDDEMHAYKDSSVVFQVVADGKKLFDSGVMRLNDPAKRVDVALGGARELLLLVGDAGDGISCDHADWAEATLYGGATEPTAEPDRYEVKAHGLRALLDADGNLNACAVGERREPWRLASRTRLSGCRPTAPVAVAQVGEGYAFTRALADAAGHRATVTESFLPDGDAVRWELSIASPDPAWSTPLTTRLTCRQPTERQFWTAWGSPDTDARVPWTDPLVPTSLPTRTWHYGNVAQGVPTGTDYVALPLLTLLAPDSDTGLSLVLSPDDVLLNLDFGVTANGQLSVTRRHHRLGGGQTLKLTAHLVAHEASWRGGLRFLTTRYPHCFDPPNPRAHQLAGCGAYSTGERPLDVAKFKQMAFGLNWKLSDDFPYMGMFLPPVKDPEQRWTRSGDERSAAYVGPTTSCRQLNDYAKYMRANGFGVLSYFNVTEFGKNMYGRKAVLPADSPDLWQDPVAFLQAKLPHAVWDPGLHTCYNAFIVDVGDPDYQAFMLEQAARNTALLPDTEGLCIDRADWLRYYNPRADDGVSWVEDRPARALFRSWLGFMDKLGPLLHGADKVVFSNMMTMRLELCRQLDGLYTEFGNHGPALNASALLGLRKPVLCWTYNDNLHLPDPDALMQRHLHMGCFPTAPYPANNHCINPEPKADRLYLDYGPLLATLRGKRWVLAPRCVETSTPGVRVNLFEVPGGWVLPVTGGGNATTATVSVRGLGALTAAALHPGGGQVAVVPTARDDACELRVPLVRGCAMVKLTPAR